MSLTVTQKKVTLDTPIVRGKEEIKEITLRKPNVGELRGLSMVDLLNMDINAVSTLLPRIGTPVISKEEVKQLDPADFVQLAGEVAGFMIPKSMKDEPPAPTSLNA